MLAEPSPIVAVYTVPAKPVSVPGTKLFPSNLRTWLVVAPVGSIVMPLTLRELALTLPMFTVEGRLRV